MLPTCVGSSGFADSVWFELRPGLVSALNLFSSETFVLTVFWPQILKGAGSVETHDAPHLLPGVPRSWRASVHFFLQAKKYIFRGASMFSTLTKIIKVPEGVKKYLKTNNTEYFIMRFFFVVQTIFTIVKK